MCIGHLYKMLYLATQMQSSAMAYGNNSRDNRKKEILENTHELQQMKSPKKMCW